MKKTPFDIGAQIALREKTAVTGAIAKWLIPKAIHGTKHMKWLHPAVKSGTGFGLFSGLIGAAAAPEGERIKGFGKGFAEGMMIGAPAGAAGHLAKGLATKGRLGRMSPLMAENLGRDITMGTGFGLAYAPEGEKLKYTLTGALGGAVGGALGGSAGRFAKPIAAKPATLWRGATEAAKGGALSGVGGTGWQRFGGMAGRRATGLAGTMGSFIGVPMVLNQIGTGSDPTMDQYNRQRSLHAIPRYGMQGMTFVPR
jgi:hypothetical protein